LEGILTVRGLPHPCRRGPGDSLSGSRQRGVNNRSPSLDAKLIEALGPTPGGHIVHVGAGAGYYSAILAELVGPSGRVTAVEFDAALVERARQQ